MEVNKPASFTESARVELKEILTDDIEKEVVAFLNTDGGYLYIGVRDDGVVTGVGDADLLQRRITDRIKNNILPAVLGLFDVEVEEYNGKQVIKITISSGPEKPYYISKYGMAPKGCYIRVGSSCQPMTVDMIQTLFRKRTFNTLSNLESPIQTLSFSQLEILYNAKGFTINNLFARNLGLVNEAGKYNYAAFLLADTNSISMRVAQYAGADKLNLASVDEFGYCSLVRATQQILDKLDVVNTNQARVTGIVRKEMRLVDRSALREAVINAVVHNDYSSGISPVVEVFSDKIVITSSGGLPQNLSREEFFQGFSAPRNRELMRVFRDLGFVEQLGNGMRKILDKYDESAFQITDHFIRVTFHFKTMDTKYLDKVSDFEKAMIRIIAENPSIAQDRNGEAYRRVTR